MPSSIQFTYDILLTFMSRQQEQSSLSNSLTNQLLPVNQSITQDVLPIKQEVKQEESQPIKQRLMSLDIHRGFTILGMILADQTLQIDGACWWLIHPQWNGLSVADLVFPSFLFIMGTAIPLAVNKNKPLKFRNILRVILLFAIGFFLNVIGDSFNFSQIRILGILQRMSVCYGLNLFIHWFTDLGTHPIKRKLCAVFMVGLVILYTALMLSWSNESQGCPKYKNLDPDCTIAGYVDIAVFSKVHLYQQKAPDPQGIISTLTAAFTTYVGYLFGLMVQNMKREPQRLVKYWLAFSFISLLMVYPLTLVMPFNKHIYSISYLFLTLSICAIALSLFMVLADILPKKIPDWQGKIQTIFKPIVWMGVNPLAIFIIREIVSDILDGWISYSDGQTPYEAFYYLIFAGLGPYIGTLVYSLFWGVVYILIAGVLFRYKLFLKL